MLNINIRDILWFHYTILIWQEMVTTGQFQRWFSYSWHEGQQCMGCICWVFSARLVKHIKSESQWCEKERECRESRLAIGQISTHDGAHRHSQAFWFADPLAQSAFHFLELVPDDENSCLVGETVKDIIVKARIWFTHYTNNLKIHLEVKSIFYRPPATI